jgi:hypothetical protein
MPPRVPSTILSLAYSKCRGKENVRCATRLAFIILTEPALVYTFVSSLAAVVAFVKVTVNAKEVTGCANDAAEANIRTHFNDRVIKLSA